ncbi:helix-turn-helix domain-containing protein [Weissella confusa]|nr:helix-turn-helix domain-containing protein [Weissella confusa]
MIELTQNRNVDSNVFALQYMRQSIPWQLMRETFNETMRSYEDFAVRNLTTVSSARNGKLQLDEFFEQHGITITQDYTLTGNEAEIRAVYFRLFVKYFADRIFPFSDEELALANQAIKAIIKIISPEETKIRQSKRIALRFSTAI